MSKKLHLLPKDHKPRFLVCGHFLHCLPAEICYHLLQEDIKDPRALARKADELWWQNSNMVALNALSYSSDDQEVDRRSHGKEAKTCKSPCSYEPVSPLSSTSWILFLEGIF